MKKLLRTLCTCTLTIAALLLEQIVIACGGGEDPYDYYYSFFHNNTAGSPAYMPFYFVSGYTYYEDWNRQSQRPEEEDLNLKEWRGLGMSAFSLREASDFIYKYSYAQLSNLYYHLEQGKALQLPDSVLRNGMTRWFRQQKDLEALGYLMYAKKCEPNAALASRWDTPERDKSSMAASIKGGLQLWKAAKQDFFRWRYAYQVLRMAFYSGDYTRTQNLYQELIGDQTADNIMYYRCLSLKAGAAYQAGHYDTAAYLYARCFNGTDDNKHGNYISYDWCFRPHGEQEDGPRASRDAVLRLCRTPQEKAVIALMDGLHTYAEALPLMEEAYRLDPSVKGLEVVMTREINKLEMRLLDPELRRRRGFNNLYNNYTYYRAAYEERNRTEAVAQRNAALQQSDDLVRFGSKVYREGKAGTPAFWPLAVAYLHLVREDWAQAERWVALAAALNPEGRCLDMLQLEKLLLAVNKNGKLDARAEAGLLPSLRWLEQRARNDYRFGISYRNLMVSVLPNVYMQQQDTLKALLCIAKGTTGPGGKGFTSYWQEGEPPQNPAYAEPGFSDELQQVSTAGILALRDWIRREKKSAYESFLVQYPPYQEGALDMYLATRYLRQQDFAAAAQLLQTIPAALRSPYAFPDPFAERWIDTQEPADTAAVADKLSFAREMQQLQATLDKAGAATLYRYANGLYSMTYYGLSWKAVQYYRGGVDGMAYYATKARNQLLPEQRNYYTAAGAAKYYQQAFDKTDDPELKAKCLFMLSKCWQKSAEIPDEHYWNPEENNAYYHYTIHSPYFKILAASYRQTHAYKEQYEECSYLRYYVRKMNKK